MKSRVCLRLPMVVTIGLLIGACGETGAGSPATGFVDVAAAAGIDMRHDAGAAGAFLLPEIMGAGGALFDYDNDGDLDVYLINGGGPAAAGNRLYRQDADGTFHDVTLKSGLADSGYGMGVAVGDTDNDGDLDVLVTHYGQNRLYRNGGDGTFTDVTAASGITGSAWSTSAAFCDIDGDGYLDLYIARYVTNEPPMACSTGAGEIDYCGPKTYRAVADQLWRNLGDGRFADIGAQSGITSSPRNGLGVVCFDFNGDARPDFLVANDGEHNQLWINDGSGGFEDRGVAMGVAVNILGETEASMGIALGDIDNDGAADVLMTNLDGETNTFYRGSDDHVLMDMTGAAGLGARSQPFTGFGVEFLDVDLDGDLDVAIANGRVRRGAAGVFDGAAAESHADRFRRLYAEPNQIMENAGDGTFLDGCSNAGDFCAALAVSRGLLAGDIDNDGDLDILVTNANGPVSLFRNDTMRLGNWLIVRAMLSPLNRDAVGAMVRVRVGDRWLQRPVMHTRSYLVSGDASVHYGLGAASRVDEMVVTWPDGTEERFPGVDSNQRLTLRRGEGRTATADDRS